MNELLGHLDEVQASISAAIGSHTVATVAQSCSCIVSTDLLAQQQAQSDNIAALQTQMQTLQAAREQLDETYADTQANWATVSEPVLRPALLSSIVKFALIGFVVGVFVVAGIVCVQFLAAGRVYSAKELKRTCRPAPSSAHWPAKRARPPRSWTQPSTGPRAAPMAAPTLRCSA